LNGWDGAIRPWPMGGWSNSNSANGDVILSFFLSITSTFIEFFFREKHSLISFSLLVSVGEILMVILKEIQELY
jgi:hypothetical protein